MDLEHPSYQSEAVSRREAEDLEERAYAPPKGTGRAYKRPGSEKTGKREIEDLEERAFEPVKSPGRSYKRPTTGH